MSVIVPGSYDPVTVGHLDVIRAAVKKYGEVYAVVFINGSKAYRFSEAERVKMLSLATADIPGVTVDFSSGRVIDYMREYGIEKIVKGYRNEEDLAWERIQADYNFENGGYETELIECLAEHGDVSSTLVRKRLDSGECVADLLPEAVLRYLKDES